MQHGIEFFFFQLFKSFVLLLPLTSARRVGAGMGRMGYYILHSRRRIALENLRQAFPEKPRRDLKEIAKGSFQNYGITMMEFMWFPNLTDAILTRMIRIQNPELLLQAYVRGKGMVMLAGHFGNWELIALSVPRLLNLTFSIIVQTQSNEAVDKVVNAHRTQFGNRVIPMGISVREILRTLHQGGIIAIAPDQSGPMEGVFVEFFGRNVATHQGPAVFALRNGAPLQMGFMIRSADGGYDVVLEEVSTQNLRGDFEEQIVQLTQRHTSLLEHYIRRHPEHWLWMHRRWKHTQDHVRQSASRPTAVPLA